MPATLRDHERLQGVHPRLQKAILNILNRLPMFVVQGVRTTAQQQALYAQGRTAPGKIVTMKDGVIHKSNHQPRADGFGHAVDCAWLGPDPFADAHPWEAYGAMVEAAGLTWGGRWTHPHDSPHAELA